MVNRICKFCKEEKDESICLKGQNVCYDCNNRRRREQRLKKLAEQTNNPKTCNVCKEVKTEKDFPVNCLQCKKCAKKIFVTNARKKTEDMKKQGITKKTCIKCEEEQDIDKYREGENVCNVCKNEMGKAWIDNNQEHFKELCKKYRQDPEKKEKANKYKRESYKNNPIEKLSKRWRAKLRDFLNTDISKEKEENLMEVFGCSKESFRDWIEFCFKENMKWSNYGELWNLDHIVPCSSFNLEDEKELKKCFKWKNTAPVYCEENYKKFKNIDENIKQYYKDKAKLFKSEATQNLIQKKKDKLKKKEIGTKKIDRRKKVITNEN